MIQGQVNADEAVIPLELRGPTGLSLTLDAVVDTGFSGFLAVPPNVATTLQLSVMLTRYYELADCSKVAFDIHRIIVRWDGQDRTVETLVASGGALVGMQMLRGYQLFIDAIDGGDVLIQPRP